MDIGQEQVTDSGILSLVIAATYFNKTLCASRLAYKLGLSSGEATHLDLCRCAGWAGLRASIERVDLSRLKHLPMPALTKLDNRYCVMLASNRFTVKLQLPHNRSVVNIAIQEWGKRSNKELILLAQKGGHRTVSRDGLFWFIPPLIKQAKHAKSILMVSFFIQIMTLMTPLLFAHVVDKVLISRSLSSLQVLALAMLALALFEPTFSYLRGWLFSHLSAKLCTQFNSRIYRHLLSLPLSFFSQRQTGQITARMDELNRIRQILSGSVLVLVLDILFLGVFLGILFTFSSMLTWIVVASLVLYFLFWLSMGKVLRTRVDEHCEYSATNRAFLHQAIRGIETIKTNAVEDDFIKGWQTHLAQQLKAGFKARYTSIVAEQGITLIQKTTSAVLLWWGVKLVLDGELSAGGLVAFNMLASQVAHPILRLAQVWQDFQHVCVSVRRIGDILKETPETCTEGLPSNPNMQGGIRFSQVRFRYQYDGPEIIRNLSLNIKAGEFIGITGRSGSGKSTLTRLLQRMYSPDSGEVYIDGLDVAIADAVELRRSMGVVLQENVLFTGSVSDNIRQCKPQASDEEVVRAAKLAGAHSFIEQLAWGYSTPIGERGCNLSGGQRQRIALARALITNPRILILDEATSALDYESEAAIIAHLPQITKGRTVISIAHRLNTLRHCDRIFVIEEGQVQECGDHTSLLARQDRYARLWASQVG